MSRKAKRAIVGVLGGIGIVMILLGVLAHVYATTTGIIIAVCCWITSGVLERYWGLRRKKGES